jgi:hypothetical protein
MITSLHIIGRVSGKIILEVPDKLANYAGAILEETMVPASGKNTFKAFDIFVQSLWGRRPSVKNSPEIGQFIFYGYREFCNAFFIDN